MWCNCEFEFEFEFEFDREWRPGKLRLQENPDTCQHNNNVGSTGRTHRLSVTQQGGKLFVGVLALLLLLLLHRHTYT